MPLALITAIVLGLFAVALVTILDSMFAQSRDGSWSLPIIAWIGTSLVLLMAFGCIGAWHIGSTEWVPGDSQEVAESAINGQSYYVLCVPGLRTTDGDDLDAYIYAINRNPLLGVRIATVETRFAHFHPSPDGSAMMIVSTIKPTGMWRYISIGSHDRKKDFYLPIEPLKCT